MEQGFGLVGSQLIPIQQVKNLSNDGIRRFREEVGFGESGFGVVIEPSRFSGLGILLSQFPNRVKDVLFFQDTLLFQHLDQGSHFPHAGESEFFQGDNVFGVKRGGREAHVLAIDGPPLAYRIIRFENVTKVGFS